MLSDAVYHVILTACVVQVISHLFTFARTKRRSSLWLGVPAFVLLTVATALTYVSLGNDSLLTNTDIILTIRLAFLLGSLLWIAEQLISINRFLEIR